MLKRMPTFALNNFNPFVVHESGLRSLVNFECGSFPSGFEANVRLNNLQRVNMEEEVRIVTRILSDRSIIEILMANDIARRNGAERVHLFLPFVPYARQDRIMNPGEALAVKVFADLINSQNFKTVTVFDPHSDVAPALLDRTSVINNQNFAKVALNEILAKEPDTETLLISPDAGAFKKMSALCKAIDYQEKLVVCGKVRDVSDHGEIKRITVDTDDLSNKNLVIIDDICDGGATFIALATELKKRGAKNVYLVVSHGLLTKGHKHLRQGGVDGVYMSDSIQDYNSQSGFVKTIPMQDFIFFDPNCNNPKFPKKKGGAA